MDNGDRLVQMANDIGNFFRAQPDRDAAVAGIANHIRSYWTPRMREKLAARVERDGTALDDLPRQALGLLERQPSPPKDRPIGGDAG